jgi:hypothetical protein
MWNLKKLQVDTYREHIDIAFPANEDPEKIIEAEKLALLGFYARYESGMGRPSVDLKGEATRQEFRQHVHDAYSQIQDGRRLGTMRSELKLLAESCPYCGYGPIEELDHLLQRNHYKLFSIFPLNLVPCCGTCNKGKRKIPSANPSEHQVHVYLEDLSAYDFLRVEVRIDPEQGGLLARYYVEQSAVMPDDLYRRVVNHLEEFDLQRRYAKQANIFLGELEYSITSSFATGGSESLKLFLAGTAEALARRFGINDWRTALMRGLSECQAFCEGGFQTAMGLRPSNTDQAA